MESAFGQHPDVGDIRGRGLFLGPEMVADRRTKEPFDPALKIHARIGRAARAEGLICYPAGGTIDGMRGDHVLLEPPSIPLRIAWCASVSIKTGFLGSSNAAYCVDFSNPKAAWPWRSAQSKKLLNIWIWLLIVWGAILLWSGSLINYINGIAFNVGLVFRLAGSACKTFLTSSASCLVIVPRSRSGPKCSTRMFR